MLFRSVQINSVNSTITVNNITRIYGYWDSVVTVYCNNINNFAYVGSGNFNVDIFNCNDQEGGNVTCRLLNCINGYNTIGGTVTELATFEGKNQNSKQDTCLWVKFQDLSFCLLKMISL